MRFKYTLPDNLVKKVVQLDEFANGGHQVTIRLKNGRVYHSVLISNSMWIIAIRGYSDLPFSLSEIEDIFQTESDKNSVERGGWDFWDEWARETLGKRGYGKET